MVDCFFQQTLEQSAGVALGYGAFDCRYASGPPFVMG